MATTRLIVVRHGETLANREFRYIGKGDHPLTEHGQMQAERLAEALSVLPLTAVYSSPLQRAYHTAEPIAARHDLAVQVLDALSESSFGEWEGLSRAEVLVRSEQDAGLLRIWERDTAIAPPSGESFAAVRDRVVAAVELLVGKHPDQTVALVSHVGSSRYCCAWRWVHRWTRSFICFWTRLQSALSIGAHLILSCGC